MKTIPRWLVGATGAVMIAWMGGGVWFYRSQHQQFQRDAEKQLEAVARLKVDQIVHWRAERLSDANALILSPLFTERVQQLLRGTDASDNQDRLTHWLHVLQKQNQALRAFVLDASGNLRLAFPGDKTHFDPMSQSAAMQAIRSNQAVLSDLHRSHATSEIHLDIIVPIGAPNAAPGDGAAAVGAIDVELNPEPFLYPLIQSWPTPSESAETLLVRREGEEVVFLNELRHRKDTALSLRLPISKEDLPAARAARGQEGCATGADYRGVPVLACVRAVPDSPWFLVAKVDAAEAFAGWRFRSLLILALLIGSTCTLIILGVAVWQRFAKAHYRALFRAEESHRQVESNYRSLFDNMLNGFAYCRMIYENDEPRDFIYLAVNDAFGALTGLKNVPGRRASEVIPGICEKDPELIARYGRVARTGVHEMFETYVESLGQWFSISVYQPEPDHFAVVFDVITERKRAELALRMERNKIAQYLDVAEVILVAFDDRARITLLNRKGYQLLGYAEGGLAGKNWFEVVLPAEEAKAAFETYRKIMTGSLATEEHCESRVVTQGGEARLIAWRNVALKDGAGRIVGTLSSGEDITERKRAEARQQLAIDALQLINRPNDVSALVGAVMKLIKNAIGCDAVGLRVRKGEDFPYYVQNGFSAEFVKRENYLCARDQAGEVVRDASGNPVLECMCGNILCGRTNPAMPFFTAGGSFWTNSTTDLLESTTEKERLTHTRNHCNVAGYESVALIPLRSGDEIVGLLQLNDRRRGRFTPEMIRFFEGLAASIGIALKRNRNAEELQESEERYRLLADYAEDFVALKDTQGNRFYVSPSYYRVTGWTPEEVQQAHWNERLHPEDISTVERARTANLAGETTLIEHRVRCKDGGWLWVEARCKPILGADGKVERLVVWSRDITDRKLAWEEIRRLNQTLEERVQERTAQLKAANKELEAFSYSVSHDLRAPLRGISGFVGILVEDYAKQLDDEGRRLLGTVSSEANRMGQLIDELLAFSRLGRQAMQSAEVDMGAMAQKAFDECAALEPGRQIKLTLHPLPAAWGDAAMMPHVWGNLISNAVKYTRPRPVAEIEITGRADDGEIVYCVKDNGVGFDTKYAQKLFGVFQRLHADTDFEGTGVGLALVHRIVQRHGGRVWAESTLGEGAVFYFALPARGQQAVTITPAATP